MQLVRINEFASVQDYCGPSPVCASRIEPLQIADLWRYAITTGGVSGRSLSARSVPFYCDLVAFALEDKLSPSGDYLYCQTDDYAASETSLKSVVSFLLGMIRAHVIAEKRYGVTHLLHLKDCRIDYKVKRGSRSNCHPDFAGIANERPVILVEAKGASRGRVSSGVVQHARNDQLDNIAEVSYDGGRSYDVVKDGVKKCVVCSAFKHEPYGCVWELSDVDPVGRGEVTISFDFDKALYCYYEPVVSLIASGGCKEDVDLGGRHVVVAESDYGKVCLKASIWEACSSRDSVNDAKGLFEVIHESLEEGPSLFDAEFSSCGMDGVSVIIG